VLEQRRRGGAKPHPITLLRTSPVTNAFLVSFGETHLFLKHMNHLRYKVLEGMDGERVELFAAQ
jgi:hypothetical protein